MDVVTSGHLAEHFSSSLGGVGSSDPCVCEVSEEQEGLGMGGGGANAGTGPEKNNFSDERAFLPSSVVVKTFFERKLLVLSIQFQHIKLYR